MGFLAPIAYYRLYVVLDQRLGLRREAPMQFQNVVQL